MTEPEQFDRLATLIAESLRTNAAQITRNTTAADVDGWDSLSHANLIMAIESAYGFQFPDEEIFSFADVGALYDRTMQLRTA
jgi:acyl carrier protein